MRTLAVVLSLLIVNTAYGAECLPQDYDATAEPDYDCPGPDENSVIPRLDYRPAVGIEKGTPAGFSGLLLEQNQILQLGLRIKGLRRLRYMDTQKGAQVQKLELDLQKKLSTADMKLVESQRENYKEQAVSLQKELQTERAWYRSWSFGFALGTAVTCIAAVSLAMAVR
jgi:hypothetical protein